MFSVVCEALRWVFILWPEPWFDERRSRPIERNDRNSMEYLWTKYHNLSHSLVRNTRERFTCKRIWLIVDRNTALSSSSSSSILPSTQTHTHILSEWQNRSRPKQTLWFSLLLVDDVLCVLCCYALSYTYIKSNGKMIPFSLKMVWLWMVMMTKQHDLLLSAEIHSTRLVKWYTAAHHSIYFFVLCFVFQCVWSPKWLRCWWSSTQTNTLDVG